MKQKKIGIILTYFNVVVGLLINIYLTPFLIHKLGDVDYSIYRVMQSFAGPLSMFHFGLSAIVTRCIVKSNTCNNYNKEDKSNSIAHALISSAVMSLVVLFAGIIMLYLIPSIYGDNYSFSSVQMGQKLFFAFVLSTVFSILTDTFSGCLVGHEQYVVSAAIPLVKNVVKVVLIIVLLRLGVGVYSVAIVDLFISVLVFAFCLLFSLFILNERPKLTHWDKRQIIEITAFGVSILLQTIVNQVNNNVDTMILGAVVSEKYIITMYSSALTVYSVYNSIVSVMTNFFLPKATKLITQNASGEQLTDFIIGPGRYQAIIGVACISGFALFGKNFISVWIGAKYIDAYYITLMLIIPVTIPLVENAALSILDATLKRLYRSVVLVIMAVLNVLVSILLIKYIGFWGAALGTVVSLIIGHGFLMNIYYSKVFSINIKRVFVEIFKEVLPIGIVSSIICIPIALFLPNTLLFFIIKAVLFLIVYCTGVWLFGLNKCEKNNVLSLIRSKHNSKA